METVQPSQFRQVLGHYPTGVCIVLAKTQGGQIAGMTVGSFTSVSLAPPMVAFFPARNSKSWAALSDLGSFCINILHSDQQWIGRQVASDTDDKFAGIKLGLSARGMPIISDCVAWIDCDTHSVTPAGDHFIAMGDVVELAVEAGGLPLVFCRGDFGRFSI